MYYVYILSNYSKTTFYVGMTDDPGRRMYEHKNKIYPGFTEKYNCDILLYYEEFEGSDQAAHREHQLKRYRKEWKRNLIDSLNPDWKDLTDRFPFEP